MDDETRLRFEAIEKRLDLLEGKKGKLMNKKQNENFVFADKKEDHSFLLKELLQSDFCHSKNGLTREEIIGIFKENNRPVVPKKIKDLVNKWVQRKKIEMIKEYGNSKYFWVENETKKSDN